MKYFLLYSMTCILFGCASRGQNIRNDKLNCYSEKLGNLKKLSVYNEIMTQFTDTFKVMKKDIRIFGAVDRVKNQIDEAIFFNRDKSECLLIVSQKSNSGLVFGNARIVHGILKNQLWIFKPSISYTYERDFFDLYPENSFENISKLARYSVLTDGEARKKGCEIDMKYWFIDLNK